MRFSVVYSFDLPANVSVKNWQPPHHRSGLWDWTEGNEFYAFDYLADRGDDDQLRNGKHRSYWGILTREQLDEFVAACGLTMTEAKPVYPRRVRLPELRWAPTFVFRYELQGHMNEPIHAEALVTPIPETTRRPRRMERIAQAMFSVYGPKAG